MIFEAHQNPYFVRLYFINILTKHIFNYKIVKNRSSFFIYFFEGGKVRNENGGKKMKIRKCFDDF